MGWVVDWAPTPASRVHTVAVSSTRRCWFLLTFFLSPLLSFPPSLEQLTKLLSPSGSLLGNRLGWAPPAPRQGIQAYVTYTPKSDRSSHLHAFLLVSLGTHCKGARGRGRAGIVGALSVFIGAYVYSN